MSYIKSHDTKKLHYHPHRASASFRCSLYWCSYIYEKCEVISSSTLVYTQSCSLTDFNGMGNNWIEVLLTYTNNKRLMPRSNSSYGGIQLWIVLHSVVLLNDTCVPKISDDYSIFYKLYVTYAQEIFKVRRNVMSQQEKRLIRLTEMRLA